MGETSLTVIQELIDASRKETEARLATKAILDELYRKIEKLYLSDEEVEDRLTAIEITLRGMQAKLEVIVQILAADRGIDKKRLDEIFSEIKEQLFRDSGMKIKATKGSQISIGRDVKTNE